MFDSKHALRVLVATSATTLIEIENADVVLTNYENITPQTVYKKVKAVHEKLLEFEKAVKDGGDISAAANPSLRNNRTTSSSSPPDTARTREERGQRHKKALYYQAKIREPILFFSTMPSGPHEVAAKRFSDLLFLKSKKQQQAIEAFIAGMRDRLSGEPDGPFEGGIPEVGWMGNKPYRATL